MTARAKHKGTMTLDQAQLVIAILRADVKRQAHVIEVLAKALKEKQC